MNFTYRHKQPQGYSTVRDHYTDLSALYRYLDSVMFRNREKRKPLHRYHRRNIRPGTGYDALLFFALGYLMAASGRDPVMRFINRTPPNRRAEGANKPPRSRNFNIRLERRVVFHGPLDYSGRQNSPYMNRQFSY